MGAVIAILLILVLLSVTGRRGLAGPAPAEGAAACPRPRLSHGPAFPARPAPMRRQGAGGGSNQRDTRRFGNPRGPQP